MTYGQKSSAVSCPPARPGLREHVVTANGHVAAHAVGLVADRGEGVDGRRTQLVAEALSWTTSGQGAK